MNFENQQTEESDDTSLSGIKNMADEIVLTCTRNTLGNLRGIANQTGDIVLERVRKPEPNVTRRWRNTKNARTKR